MHLEYWGHYGKLRILSCEKQTFFLLSPLSYLIPAYSSPNGAAEEPCLPPLYSFFLSFLIVFLLFRCAVCNKFYTGSLQMQGKDNRFFSLTDKFLLKYNILFSGRHFADRTVLRFLHDPVWYRLRVERRTACRLSHIRYSHLRQNVAVFRCAPG